MRVFLTIIISLVIILLVKGAWELKHPYLQSFEMRVAQKLSIPPVYDGLIGGDSRAEFGIQPSAMSHGTDLSIYNFALPSICFDPFYLNHLKSKLKSDSNKKFIVLSISSSLLRSCSTEYYRDLLDLADSNLLRKSYSILKYVFAPMKSGMLLDLLGIKKGCMTTIDEDGTRTAPCKNPLVFTRMFFFDVDTKGKRDNQFIYSELKAWIRQARLEGITVFLTPPLMPNQFVQMEARMFLPFTSDMREGLLAAGGIWIPEPEKFNFKMLDLIHLNRISGREWSEHLAKKIHEHLSLSGEPRGL